MKLQWHDCEVQITHRFFRVILWLGRLYVNYSASYQVTWVPGVKGRPDE